MVSFIFPGLTKNGFFAGRGFFLFQAPKATEEDAKEL